MRRYGQMTDAVVVPGQSAGLQLTLQPMVTLTPPCHPAPTGLYWFSDLTGRFTEESEAAYLLPEGAAGPVLGVARLLGEVCDEPITWSWEWLPETGVGGSPGIVAQGGHCIVYPLAETQPGMILLSARIAQRAFGPIVLSVLRYVCGYGYVYYPSETPV